MEPRKAKGCDLEGHGCSIVGNWALKIFSYIELLIADHLCLILSRIPSGLRWKRLGNTANLHGDMWASGCVTHIDRGENSLQCISGRKSLRPLTFRTSAGLPVPKEIV